MLDIGGGSPRTGLSLFARLLASAGLPVRVLNADFGATCPGKMADASFERVLADEASLSDATARHAPAHLSCVPVLEHATPRRQQGIFHAIEACFEARPPTSHSRSTRPLASSNASLSPALAGLGRYDLDRVERSPLHCVNALARTGTRLWYPLALRFRRSGLA